ncbi:hypothetical protein NZK35_09420 [Stieleria sp. ICT_E10.1]|uniref:hypothetical protein n=1 Tax=Stieleria sedimenti TaxID=2976331 RepID=UPI0021809079|nr:hypothetical protein [Stieleria sedimenti]MCS7466862.1 hypothetical protein [Stieleria sedimenti]
MTALNRRSQRFQFRILDLLATPLAIAIAFAASVSLDLIAMDAADWLFGIGWPGRLRELLEYQFSLPTRQLSAAGATLATPSVLALVLFNSLLAATVSRIGVQLSVLLPVTHLYVTSWFLNGEFLWALHAAHVIAIVPCWFFAWSSYRGGRHFFLGRRPIVLTTLRLTCGLILAFLVAASRSLYLNYLHSLDEIFALVLA